MGMLVVTRRRGESIMIGDDIEVKLLKIDGKQVQIGIAAPRAVPILRTEIAERIAKRDLADRHHRDRADHSVDLSQYQHRTYGVRADGTIGSD